MSEPEPIIDNTERALEVLGPKIIATLNLYRVNTREESNVLPQALFIDPKELKALAHVIQVAKSSIKGKRTIQANAWGNIWGYVNGKKFKEFGLDEAAAAEWLDEGAQPIRED